jgi:hypothetical protein
MKRKQTINHPKNRTMGMRRMKFIEKKMIHTWACLALAGRGRYVVRIKNEEQNTNNESNTTHKNNEIGLLIHL